MRERLYIDSMQEVVERANTVMVDVKGGNNVIYLPLDRIRAPRGAAEAANSEGETGSVAVPMPAEGQGVGARPGGRVAGRGRDGRV
jgi:membrane protease subunit HflK